METWVNLGTRLRPGQQRIGPPLGGRQTGADTDLRPGLSGGDELVIVAVDAVAQAPSTGVRRTLGVRDRNGSHDLADLALAAEVVAASRHPITHTGRVPVELERTWIDDRLLGPTDRGLRRHDIEEVHPPGGTVDDLPAAGASLRNVVADDGPDLDAHDLHRLDGSRGPRGAADARVERMDVALIGVPFDSAGTATGVAQAPAALRAAGLLTALQEAGSAVVDIGDVQVTPGDATRDAASGIIAPAALLAMVHNVRDAVSAAVAAGAVPLVIGGDCPVLLGCLAAIHEEPVGLLFVDGHEDAWPPQMSTTGEAADMELGFLLGRFVDDLPDPLRSALPRIQPERVVVVGARDQQELADAGVESIDGVVDVIRTEGLTQAAIGTLVAEQLDRLDALGRWWLHVDLDVLSTKSLSAVDYRQGGGLEWATLTAVTQRVLGARGVAGWTVTIYNPDLDPDGRQAATIVRYIARSASVLGSRTPR